MPRAAKPSTPDIVPSGRADADIGMNDNVSVGLAASHDDDLSKIPIPNIDRDWGAAR